MSLNYNYSKYKSSVTSFDTIPFFRCGILAGYSGILQSLIWGTVSISYIITYNTQDPGRKFETVTVLTVFYDSFIRKYEDSLAPKVLVVMCLQFVLSLVWMLGSIWLLITLHVYRWPSGTKRCAYKFWANMTFVMCIVDVIVALIFVVKYIKPRRPELPSIYKTIYSQKETEKVSFEEDITEEYIFASVFLVLFLLRGVIIWGVNLMCSAVIFSVQFLSKRNSKEILTISRRCQTESVYPLGRAVNMIETKSLNSRSSEEFPELYVTPSVATYSRGERFVSRTVV